MGYSSVDKDLEIAMKAFKESERKQQKEISAHWEKYLDAKVLPTIEDARKSKNWVARRNALATATDFLKCITDCITAAHEDEN